MKCPQCELVELTITERSGVEIDYCPTCRGVWLDRGELDKIIDRASATHPTSIPGRLSPPPFRHDHDDDDDDERDRRKRGRKGFLGDLFDF